jgi:hemerythrin-like domain-containing protein
VTTLTKTQDAIVMLKTDHRKVKDLFDQFEEAEQQKEKISIAKKAIEELKVHATIEEEIFYPAVRQQLDDEEDLMEEADEEHHVAKVLIAELEAMKGDEENYNAKFIVLAENIRHHIKEEETEMLTKARKTKIDFKALGGQMSELKEQLKSSGVPKGQEELMIEQCGLRGDSPAKKALASLQMTKN